MSKVTRWFPRNVKPVHVGVYQIRRPTGEKYYSLWNGSNWHWGWHTQAMALREPNPRFSEYQETEWRGLKEKPE